MTQHIARTDTFEGVNSLEEHFLPFSANRDFKSSPRLVIKAEGAYYWDHKGGKLVDGSSGLFCVPAGHGRREIADAVHAQMIQNGYTPHFQVGHPGSFTLAQKISRILPEPINHVFFVNSGSEAIDTALKISMAYHQAKNEKGRIRFVSRERAYHGANIGGVSLSGMIKNREAFPASMPHISLIRHTWAPEQRFTQGQPEERGEELANDLQRMVDTYGASTIAAVFVEPIAGSTGVLVPPKGYLERLREICDLNGILLVFDEVICGFGRLGAGFASDLFGVTPDIVTMAKALTNGAIPMGAVGVKDEIYDTIVDAAPDNAIEFFHGYTYSAHPAACAAGIASQNIYQDEKLFDRARELAPYFLDQVWSLKDHPHVYDIRGMGLLAGVEVVSDGVPGRRGTRLQKEMFWQGMHVKFTGDTGILAPAFICTRADVDEMIRCMKAALDALA